MHAPDLLALAREAVLDGLAEESPRTLPQIPRRRPVTRPMLHLILSELLREGLVETSEGQVPGATAYVLTPRGREAARTGGAGVLRFPRHPLSEPVTA